VSLTVTVKLHEALLPAASLVLQVTVEVPLGKVEPLAGAQVTLTGPSHKSLAVGAVKLTTALHTPKSVPCVILAGQGVRVGAWLSLTVTVKLQAAVWLLVSVAVQLTVVVPLAKSLPLAGLHT
jgi:hypothetical protein